MLNVTIGVVALQGDYEAHISHFEKLEKDNLEIKEVTNARKLNHCDGLVLPGGESEAMRKCFSYNNDAFYSALKHFICVEKKPTWGTCAGCILLSKGVIVDKTSMEKHHDNFSLGGLDIVTIKNYYRHQRDKFLCQMNMNTASNFNLKFPSELNIVCIRSPFIKEILSNDVNVLATFNKYNLETPVIAAVEQNHCLGTVFNPELTSHTSFHEYFYKKVEKSILVEN